MWLREFGARTRLYGDVHVTTLHAPAERSPWFAGVAFERDASEHLMWTGEAYWEEAESSGAEDVRGFNLGFVRALYASKTDEGAGIDCCSRAAGRRHRPRLYVGPRFVFRGWRHR